VCAPAGARSDPGWEGGRAEKQRTWGAGGAGRRAAGGVSLCGLEADPDAPPVCLRAGGCRSSRVPQKTDFLWDPILSEDPRWRMGTRPFPGHVAISLAPPRVSRRPWYSITVGQDNTERLLLGGEGPADAKQIEYARLHYRGSRRAKKNRSYADGTVSAEIYEAANVGSVVALRAAMAPRLTPAALADVAPPDLRECDAYTVPTEGVTCRRRRPSRSQVVSTADAATGAHAVKRRADDGLVAERKSVTKRVSNANGRSTPSCTDGGMRRAMRPLSASVLCLGTW